jgi:hypothetical protein
MHIVSIGSVDSTAKVKEPIALYDVPAVCPALDCPHCGTAQVFVCLRTKWLQAELRRLTLFPMFYVFPSQVQFLLVTRDETARNYGESPATKIHLERVRSQSSADGLRVPSIDWPLYL